jgi:serine protease Do
MPRLSRLCFALLFSFLSFSAAAAQQVDRDTKVRNDKQDVVQAGFWIYDDLERGIALAKQTQKPLLVVIRCIPCHACEGFDARLLDRDPLVNDLLEKFVCVRIVKGNGLDLSLFQYDYDLSFAAFFMNADKTIYGRFGTRASLEKAESEITLEGFRKAMQTALDWHSEYPLNKEQFAGKRGAAVRFGKPEEMPPLKNYRSELDYQGKVAQSCIHCHQIRDAERRLLREANQPIPDEVLYPYPMPDTLGIKLDPEHLATIQKVAPGSVAEKSGFRAGDKLLSLGGQALLSIADVQWVLHATPAPGELEAVVERGGRQGKLKLPLAAGWRKQGDISWRVTTWDLRRMATGGLVLENLPADERAELKLSDDALALRIKHVGQFGEHAAAKNAGFQKGDVIVEYSGSRAPLSETALLALGLNEHRRGARVPVTVLRNGRELDLRLPQQ